MKALLALAVFAVLAASAFASTLTVNVSGLSDTALVGTKIDILKNSVVILNGTANKFGVANFDVTDGYYIVRTTRGFYPVKVQVAKVEGNSIAKLRMDLDSNTATMYGKVSYGKWNLDGYRVYATQKGVAIKEARVYPEGVYVLTFLDEGTYDLVFSKGEWEPINISVTLAARETRLLDIELSKKSEGGIVALDVPRFADLYGTIAAKLTRGGKPMNMTEMSVLTPDGIAKINTDANGEARINAAKAGNYTFTYANITASSFVEAPIGQVPGKKPVEPKKTPVALPTPEPPAPQQKTADTTLFVIVGIAMVGIGVLLAGAVAFIMLRKQKSREGKHAQMHSRGMAHGHTREEYCQMHGHAAHPMHPEHGKEHAGAHGGHEKYMHPSERDSHPHEKFMPPHELYGPGEKEKHGKAHRKK
jgi:hypothetical protein